MTFTEMKSRKHVSTAQTVETNNCEINTPVIISIRDEDANNESRHKLLFK